MLSRFRGRGLRHLCSLLGRAIPLLPVILAFSVVVATVGPGAALAHELPGQGWFTMVDAEGTVICETGFRLSEGDEFLDASNRLWVVERVHENTAHAVMVETLDLTGAVFLFQQSYATTLLAQDGGRAQVGVYHTHSDESYVASDGTQSDPAGRGGIYKVGEVFARALEGNGLEVVHDQTNHLPHDAGAYERSRGTAANVLRGSAAIFDVHRDAAPPQAYAATVGGRRTTQIMMVVGRANPQAGANMSFAQALKSAADQAEPGLMRGILRTGGSFNQDLSSRALLLEVGAHTNRRDDAETAVRLLAPVIPAVLGVPGGGLQGPAAWRTLGLILLVVLGGGALWLYVATGGSWQAAWDKLRSLGEEFAGYLGRRPRR